jgi:magnesium transporter
MITVYVHADGSLRRADFPADGHLPPGTVWIDLLTPTQEEERAVERALSIEAPSREEMQEIEFSSRIYREGNVSYMTVSVLYGSEGPRPDTTAVTFIRAPQTLVTLRYAEPNAFRSFPGRALRQPALCATSDAALLGLLDAIVDRAADILEKLGTDQDGVSKGIFAAEPGVRRPAGVQLEMAVRQLGRVEDLNARMRDSLLSIGRVLIFLTQEMLELRGGEESSQRLKTLSRDTQSLSEHAAFLAQKSNFLLDATLGLINIEQTAIIKIFSVAASVFLPPTLIASIYGMNFEFLPELQWLYGYPLAVVMMVLSAVLPYLYFRRRGWL